MVVVDLENDATEAMVIDATIPDIQSSIAAAPPTTSADSLEAVFDILGIDNTELPVIR